MLVMERKDSFFNKGMLIFLSIGVGNAFLTLLLVYGMYDLIHLGYWFSSAIAFTICSIISYILNKKYTFRNENNTFLTAIKFTIVIVVSYMTAYLIALPIAKECFSVINVNISKTGVERIALLAGQVIFTAINYLGQRYFAFRKKTVK